MNVSLKEITAAMEALPDGEEKERRRHELRSLREARSVLAKCKWAVRKAKRGEL